jgi:hypothetical protein
MTRSGRTRRGAWRGKGPGTCVSGPLRLLLRVTWLLSPRPAASPPSLNLPSGSGPTWLADTGPPWCCSSTTPRRSPARAWRPWTWSRVWPTPQENPRHAGLELWMAAYGHQIVGRPASWPDWCDDSNRRLLMAPARRGFALRLRRRRACLARMAEARSRGLRRRVRRRHRRRVGQPGRDGLTRPSQPVTSGRGEPGRLVRRCR